MKQRSATEKLFEDGTFSRGEPWSFEIVDEDGPTEYSAGEYLAAATVGQDVAVGCVYLERDAGGDGRRLEVMNVPVVIVPGRGVWITAAVFESFQSALAFMDEQMAFARAALGHEPTDLPLFRAFVPVLPCTPAPPRSVAEHEYYDRSLYADVAGRLRTRPGVAHDPRKVDALVGRLLEVGYWVEGKDVVNLEQVLHRLPRWLVDAAGLGAIEDTPAPGLCA